MVTSSLSLLFPFDPIISLTSLWAAICNLYSNISLVANYDVIRAQGSYLPASTEEAPQPAALSQNLYLRPTKPSSVFFMGETGLSQMEKKDLIPFLKFGEDALSAMEAVDKMKPQNLRETVEV
jgi:hypothetical protein